MTILYNQYLRPAHPKAEYTAKIAFIQTTKGIIAKRLFYVKFVDESKNGLYYDNNNYLHNLLGSTSLIFEKSHNMIKDILPSINYFSYIKVIEDKQNPQLEGSIMIFKFGHIINRIFGTCNQNEIYKNVFHVSMKLSGGYPNYDSSCFTDEDMTISDNTLDLESEIFYKTINIIAEERKEKLKKIKRLNDEIKEWFCE